MCHDFLLTLCNVQENYLNKHGKCPHVQVESAHMCKLFIKVLTPQCGVASAAYQT
jgi:hypothetical protein